MGILRVLRGCETLTAEDISKLDENDIELIETVYLYSKDGVQKILAKNLLIALGKELPVEEGCETA